GGMEIEEVAAATPEKILYETVDPLLGIKPYQARNLAFGLNLPAELISPGVKLIVGLYKCFEEMDCSLLEVNPLVITRDGRLLALDAKMNFDDSALWRHKELAAMRDLNEEEHLEIEASKHNLNYIKLDGNVGCMVNGAGLAMATMDIIKLAGGEPANVLDVGGGATQEMVENAFRILMSDENVKAVLINIFGGILRCDVLARGVVEAVKSVEVDIPVVVRLEGTNVEQGREILQTSGLEFTVATGMGDAAEKVVAAALAAG
ncbi:MAG: ADP-forming succinate--CoA ligase subunit beta, partial [bacterium]